jgi:putative redox protein
MISIHNLPAGYQTIISNGRHALLADEPITSKGTDLGFSPEDLLLAALGMCKAATVRYIARKKGWPIGDVRAELEQTVTRQPDRKLSTHVSVTMHIEGDLTDGQRDELLKEADACYVHRMIEGGWAIERALSAKAGIAA